MCYLTLTKRIMRDELTNEELIECLSIPNVPVLQQAILKLIEKKIQNSNVRIKLLKYSKYMDIRFKILGLCTIGHLAIYALKRLEYIEDFQKIYDEIAKQLFDIYLKIEKYITVNEGNIVNKKMVANFRQMNKILLEEGKPPMYDELAIKEYESRIVDIQPMQGEILQILKEICDLNQREIVQLTGLAKGYIAVKRQNAEKTCYPKT